MRLAINLCTRDRAHLIQETVEKTVPNIKLPSTKLYISVDEDDQPTIDVVSKFTYDQVEVLIAPREDSLGGKYNRTFGKADVYLAMVDYSSILTPGFDQMFLEAAALFPDQFGWIYSNLANLSFPALQAVTHKTAQHLGYIYPTMFPYWFIDHWADDLARMTDRIAYVPVIADYVSRRPQSTLELRDLGFWAAFFDAQYLRRRHLAFSIMWDKSSVEPMWRKRLLEARTPLVEYRSLMINAQCREQAIQVQQSRGAFGPPPERYLRIKAAAVEELKQIRQELEGAVGQAQPERIAAAG